MRTTSTILAMNSETLILVPLPDRPEEDFWRKPEGMAFAEASFRRLARLDAPVLAVGGDERMLELARAQGLETLEAETAPTTPHPGFPQGSVDADRAARENGFEARSFAALDFRNSEAAATVAEALKALHREEAALVFSMVAPRDHPCQMYAAYQILDAGMLAARDDAWTSDLLLGEANAVWREGVAGFTASGSGVERPGAMLALLETGKDGTEPVYQSPDAPFDPPGEGESLLWFLLAPSEEGSIDLHLPFLPEDGAWRYNVQKQPVLRDKKIVGGRQLFPSILACDGSVAAWRKGELERVCADVKHADEACAVLSPETAVVVRNKIDLLSLAIRCRCVSKTSGSGRKRLGMTSDGHES